MLIGSVVGTVDDAVASCTHRHARVVTTSKLSKFTKKLDPTLDYFSGLKSKSIDGPSSVKRRLALVSSVKLTLRSKQYSVFSVAELLAKQSDPSVVDVSPPIKRRGNSV